MAADMLTSIGKWIYDFFISRFFKKGAEENSNKHDNEKSYSTTAFKLQQQLLNHSLKNKSYISSYERVEQYSIKSPLKQELEAIFGCGIIYDKRDWSETQLFYYHYTSIENVVSIMSQKRINANYGRFDRAAIVCFTILGPSTSDTALVKNNYLHQSQKWYKKIECAVAIRKSKINPLKKHDIYGRDIWQYYENIDLTRLDYKVVLRM